MTLPYVSVTKAHMVEIIVLPGLPVAFSSKMFYPQKEYTKGQIKEKIRNLEVRILRSVYEGNFTTRNFNKIK